MLLKIVVCIVDELRRFCEDPQLQVARFPLRKFLRVHLHRIIDKQKLELFHETGRKGHSYTLFCIKKTKL